ncbi:hypothetical protein ACIBSV_26975 [Embleya sp. NPDC050154]|uniref:hypothetical protein n=1 Tax=Embleya sp. NPDC050154 TaxID=3363988 RepID=UPI0037A1C297
MSEQAGPSRPQLPAAENLWTAVGQAPPAAGPSRPTHAWALGFGDLGMQAAPQPAPGVGPTGPGALAGRGFNALAQPEHALGTFRDQLTRDGLAAPSSRSVESGREANPTREAARLGMTPAGR